MMLIKWNPDSLKSLTGHDCLLTLSAVREDLNRCQEGPAIIDLVIDPSTVDLFNSDESWYGSVSGEIETIGSLAEALWVKLPEIKRSSAAAVVLIGSPELLTIPVIKRICADVQKLLGESGFDFGVASGPVSDDKCRLSILVA